MTVSILGRTRVGDAVLVVESLQSQVPSLTGRHASEQLGEVLALAARVDALKVSLVSRVRMSDVWRESDPNGTPASFLRQEHTLDHRQVKAELRLAQAYDRFPELEQACRSGRLSRDKVEVILSIGLRNEQRSEALGSFLRIFIELAERATASALRRTMELWADQIDPITTKRDDDDAHRRRYLRINQVGDGVKLDGFFGREQGMRLMAAINGALQLHHRKNSDGDRDSGEPDPDENAPAGHLGFGFVTSTSMQRADAFMESIIYPVLEAQLLPSSGGAPANICVTVPLARLRDPSGSAELTDMGNRFRDGTLRHHSARISATNGPGDLLISGSKAQQLSCDATVQRVVLSPLGKPLDIGRRTRVIPEQLRTALVIRDGGCVFPFCDKPPGWSEGHHIQHWSAGGSTSLDNLVLLCSRHHHQVHSQDIPIEFDRSGKPWVNLAQRQ